MNNKKETLKISLIAIFLGILLGLLSCLFQEKTHFCYSTPFKRDYWC